MPATHHIDHTKKLIVTTWDGEPTTQDLSEALRIYQKYIRRKPDVLDYDELVDFTNIDGFKLSLKGLTELAYTADELDKTVANCKLAIVVKTTFTYGLAQMYKTCRNLFSKKEIHIFKDKSSALNWLTRIKNEAELIP